VPVDRSSAVIKTAAGGPKNMVSGCRPDFRYPSGRTEDAGPWPRCRPCRQRSDVPRARVGYEGCGYRVRAARARRPRDNVMILRTAMVTAAVWIATHVGVRMRLRMVAPTKNSKASSVWAATCRTTGRPDRSRRAPRDADEDQHAPHQKQGRMENGEPCVVNVHRLPGGPRRPGRRARGGAVPARARVPSRGSS
jgi:hypothetical protein